MPVPTRKYWLVILFSIIIEPQLAASPVVPGKDHFRETVAEGYGSKTRGGNDGEICPVTTLQDTDKKGSLRYCVRHRNKRGKAYIPRKIVFTVGGEIRLQHDLIISTPHLTIDGLTAPAPGITIRKKSLGQGEVIISTNGPSSAHDIILRYLRFDGEWDYTEIIDNHSATLTIDGEDEPGAVYNIVLDHLTIKRSTDAGPDLWGDIKDVSIQWCLIYDSLHPMTISHFKGRQARQNISLHHNVFAHNHERNPQIRGNVHHLDYRNNVVYQWKRFIGGYGIRLRHRNNVFPTKINFVNNFFLSDHAGNSALYFGEHPGRLVRQYPGDIYLGGNYLPVDNVVKTGTADRPYPLPVHARVVTQPLARLSAALLPTVGTVYRSPDEQAVLDKIKKVMTVVLKPGH